MVRRRAAKSRPISELPIPDVVREAGESAVRQFQDAFRLAYQADALVNWCAELGTVLANEEVIDGKSERGGYPVRADAAPQWMLRITAYADRLENDLAQCNWPEGIKKLQRDWIAAAWAPKSTSSSARRTNRRACARFPRLSNVVDRPCGRRLGRYRARGSVFATCVAAGHGQTLFHGFPVQPPGDVLRIYTTRPDTLFGVTYMVNRARASYVTRLTTPEQAEAVQAYCEQAASKSDRDRQDASKEKTGVFTGSFAVNPVNGLGVPIWIADYVLINYGTGAIMAVPPTMNAIFAFAKKYGIQIVPVVDRVKARETRSIARPCWKATPAMATKEPRSTAATTAA